MHLTKALIKRYTDHDYGNFFALFEALKNVCTLCQNKNIRFYKVLIASILRLFPRTIIASVF